MVENRTSWVENGRTSSVWGRIWLKIDRAISNMVETLTANRTRESKIVKTDIAVLKLDENRPHAGEIGRNSPVLDRK